MIGFFNQNPMALFIVIFLWCGFGTVIEAAIAEKYTSEVLIWHPKIFYDDMKMNWFGSWFCFIVLILIDPFGFAIKLFLYFILLIVYLAGFISWLFTVGREDD